MMRATCKCGAEIEGDDSAWGTGYRLSEFHKQHEKCLSADLDAAREEGRRERTVEIAEDFCDFRTGPAQNYKYTLAAELKAIYPECFEKGEG